MILDMLVPKSKPTWTFIVRGRRRATRLGSAAGTVPGAVLMGTEGPAGMVRSFVAGEGAAETDLGGEACAGSVNGSLCAASGSGLNHFKNSCSHFFMLGRYLSEVV